jgi:hypothetical protein
MDVYNSSLRLLEIMAMSGNADGGGGGSDDESGERNRGQALLISSLRRQVFSHVTDLVIMMQPGSYRLYNIAEDRVPTFSRTFAPGPLGSA